MTLDVSPLFEPISVRGKTLRNRIVMPPMVVARGVDTPAGIAWYGERARGGVGLVIVEANSVYLFQSRLTVENLSPLVDAIHAGGALAAIQLFPGALGAGASPGDLSDDDLDTLVSHYESATVVCREAGFDGIEPHGAHGYTLNQFFSTERNTRDDDYGPQSLQSRSRMALRIVSAICPLLDDMLLLYRHTPVGPGYTIEEIAQLAKALIAAGVDILDLSPSSIAFPGDHAAPFAHLGAPVIAVNGLDVIKDALEILAEGRADLIAIGKVLIADPFWPTKVQEGRFDEIIRCIRCGGCSRDLGEKRPVGCTQWVD